jgi:hypothetical protein
MKEALFNWRGLSLAILCMAMPSVLYSQVKDTPKDTAEKEVKQTKAEEKSNILVIPFQPQMYNASGDQYICQKSRITPGELSDMIRRSLTSTLMYNMSDLYNVVEPPDDLRNKNSDINVIYQITHYTTLYKKLKSYYKGYPPIKIGQIIAPSYMRWGTDCVNDNSQAPNRGHHKYVKAEILRDSLFAGICKRNTSHYALFITQFEMTTRFKNCNDLQNQVFQRDIFIHYTLFDKTGKYIDGGVVGTTFQSNSNDATKILEKNLGVLTGLIIEEMRRKL